MTRSIARDGWRMPCSSCSSSRRCGVSPRSRTSSRRRGSARIAAMLTVARETRWGQRLARRRSRRCRCTPSGWLIACGTPIGWIVAGVGVVAICVGEATHRARGGVEAGGARDSQSTSRTCLSAGGWIGGLADGGDVRPTRDAKGRAEQLGVRRVAQLVRAYHSAAVQCVTLVIVTAVVAELARLTAFPISGPPRTAACCF